ncbi:hypothetical protein HYN59_14550 [Flavobacterium album]|uniref:Uncharacterized protein n=1 Tax=Flavobacterium album TaxID=2175091 RepID=A0A2S1R0T8_9FLAO|nr:hypothetical protein [Flavobacterium album]AWH86255.1 hypothetical protein HYN59_14550 [Flavobacterium album]
MDFRKPKTLLLSLLVTVIGAFIIILVLGISLGSGSLGTWGMNKTVGWAWDLMNDLAALLAIFSTLLFVFGYTFLWILKMRLNSIVSVINLCFLFALPVMWGIEHIKYEYLFTFLTALGVIISFIINTVFAIRYKLKDKQVS